MVSVLDSATGNATNANPFIGLSPTQLQEIPVLLFSKLQKFPVYYPLGDVDQIMQTRMVTGIHQGARIGSGAVMGIMLLLLARSYRSIMFALYELNFVLMIIQSALQSSWIFSFNASITEFMTNGDIPHSNLHVSIAEAFFGVLLIMSLLATLVMQIYIACSDLRKTLRWSVTGTAMLACFPSYLIWFWRFVLTAIQNDGPRKGKGSYGSVTYDWVYKGAWPAFAASTSACALILCIKLYTVQHARAKMGVATFDPIQALLRMAFQNSVLPAILAIVAAAISPDNFSGQSISAATIPITAVLLPAGYIMAQYNMLKGSAHLQQLARVKPPAINVDTAGASMKKSEFTAQPYSADTPFSEITSYRSH